MEKVFAIVTGIAALALSAVVFGCSPEAEAIARQEAEQRFESWLAQSSGAERVFCKHYPLALRCDVELPPDYRSHVVMCVYGRPCSTLSERHVRTRRPR